MDELHSDTGQRLTISGANHVDSGHEPLIEALPYQQTRTIEDPLS